MNGVIEYLPLVSLVTFFTAFLWIACLAYRPSAKKRLQEHAFIPLKEDNHGR